MFVGKHVIDIVLSNILSIDESNLVVDENMIDVPPMFGPVKSYLLKVLMQEAKALQEIIVTSTVIKSVFEGLTQMLGPYDVGASTFQVFLPDDEKEAMILGEDEDMIGDDEDKGVEYEAVSDDDSHFSS